MGANDQLREVQQMLAWANEIAKGGNPHVPLSFKCSPAANKVALRTAILANQPETRSKGIDQAIEYYVAGGVVWCSGNSIEVLTTSHAHIPLAADALNLKAGIEHSKELQGLATTTLRLWTAAAGPIERRPPVDTRFSACTYVDENGRLIRLTAGARGQDRRGNKLEKFPTNSAADEVMEGLLSGGKHWRRAGERYDVAVTVLKQLIASGKIGADELLGDDFSPITDSFGYHVVKGEWGFYSYFTDLTGPGFSPPLYGAGRVQGETVLCWERDEAIAKGEQLRRQK